MKPAPLLATFLLAVGLHAADTLTPGLPQAEGVDPARLQRVYDLVGGTVASGQHAGANVLVARHGRIVAQRSFGSRDLDSGAPMQPYTIVRIYSMTKVVTAVATLQLFEQNQFGLDSPVTAWLPELKDLKVFAGGTAESPQLEPARSPITVRMLLNHTAGFTYDFFAGSPVHDLYKKQDLWNSASLDEFMTKVAKLPLIAQPGTAFHYGINDDILGVLIQRVGGSSFEAFVERNTFAGAAG